MQMSSREKTEIPKCYLDFAVFRFSPVLYAHGSQLWKILFFPFLNCKLDWESLHPKCSWHPWSSQ